MTSGKEQSTGHGSIPSTAPSPGLRERCRASAGEGGMFLQTTEPCRASLSPAELCSSQGRRGSAQGWRETAGKQKGCEKGGGNPPSKQETKQKQLFPTEDPIRVLLPLLVRLTWWKIQLKPGHKRSLIKAGPQKVISMREPSQQLFPLRRWSRAL